MTISKLMKQPATNLGCGLVGMLVSGCFTQRCATALLSSPEV